MSRERCIGSAESDADGLPGQGGTVSGLSPGSCSSPCRQQYAMPVSGRCFQVAHNTAGTARTSLAVPVPIMPYLA